MLVQGIEESGKGTNNAEGVRKALLLCSGFGLRAFLMAWLPAAAVVSACQLLGLWAVSSFVLCSAEWDLFCGLGFFRNHIWSDQWDTSQQLCLPQGSVCFNLL